MASGIRLVQSLLDMNKNLLFLISLFLVSSLVSAASADILDRQYSVSVEFARELIVKAREVASERGFALSFAVSDADGFLVCSETMKGAKRMTMRNAIDKSHTAALKRTVSAREGGSGGGAEGRVESR